MKVELAHDILAKTVYERASANDRMRLRVLNLLRVKHQLYREHNGLLTADEVKIIAPFEKELTLTKAERNFLNRSKLMSRKHLLLWTVGSSFCTFSVIGISLWFMLYYKKATVKLEATNNRYKMSKQTIIVANKQLRTNLLELHFAKDSLEREYNQLKKDNEELIKQLHKTEKSK
jgi:hypothetical protein